ncbi:MAG: nucleotidyltransferase family protein [Endomicrobiales bacterium]|nr:nucleotidyltransferase family protein [Endomicrobiales bacterium]
MDTAVILAGGKGIRFGANSEDVPKPMSLVAGKPILHYIITMLKSMDVTNLYVIVAYKKHILMDYFKTGKDYGVNIQYRENLNINSTKKSGLSDAVLLMKDELHSPFITILGDEIYSGTRHIEMKKRFESHKDYDAMIAVHKTANIEEVKKNYSVKLDENNLVLDLEEKPQVPWNDLIGCGTYFFKESIFEYIQKTPYSKKSGRRELAESMKMMLQDGKKIHAFEIGGKYLNINYTEDMITAENILGGNSGNIG